MNKFYFILLLTLIIQKTSAQLPSFEWAKAIDGIGDESAKYVTTDLQGNIYVTGYFASASIVFGTTTLINSTSSFFDMFIVKYDQTGNVLWAKSAVGNKSDIGNSVTTDNQGNVYVTGEFRSSSLVFDSFTLNVSSPLSSDMFLVKYDSNGNVQWAKQTVGSKKEVGNAVATDVSGNVYVAGSFETNAVLFDSFSLPNNTLSDEIFIVKYDSLGAVVWARKAGSTAEDVAYGVEVDTSNNVYVVGDFYGPSIIVENDTLFNNGIGAIDMIIIKYDEAGNLLWAKNEGGTLEEHPSSLVIDEFGDIYVAGTFSSANVIIGSDTITNNNTGEYNFFIIKYNESGTVQWAKGWGGSLSEYGRSITINAAGNLYFAGIYESSDMVLINDTILNNGNFDVFVMNFDELGNVYWVKTLGGTSYDVGNAVASDAVGNIYLVGDFISPSIDFGATSLVNNIGSYESFVAKLNPIPVNLNMHSDRPMVIFPNPFNSQTTIAFANEQNLSTLIITDVQGRLIKSNVVSGNQFVFEKGLLESGLYFVTLITNKEEQYTQKIILQ